MFQSSLNTFTSYLTYRPTGETRKILLQKCIKECDHAKMMLRNVRQSAQKHMKHDSDNKILSKNEAQKESKKVCHSARNSKLTNSSAGRDYEETHGSSRTGCCRVTQAFIALGRCSGIGRLTRFARTIRSWQSIVAATVPPHTLVHIIP